MSSLHVTLANLLLDHIRSEQLSAGYHLTEQSLERVLGASRSPIRGALAHLAAKGIVEPRPPRRGLFLACDAADLGPAEIDLSSSAEEQTYLSLARDQLGGRLPPVLSENEAMRRYSLTRERMRRVLSRAAKEGWMEQRASKGWSFLPMIDSAKACEESYALRGVLEPAALLMADFRLDAAVIDRLRAQQLVLADGGYRTAGHAEMFQANASLHEGLAGLSGNRFVTQVIARQNQLRRLLEYRETDDRDHVRRQCEGHLEILDTLERGDRKQAAALLAKHLSDAVEEKILQLRKAFSIRLS